MADRPLHCFHNRELDLHGGTVYYRQCCNCDRTPAQCLNNGCDGTRWSTWAKEDDDA